MNTSTTSNTPGNLRANNIIGGPRNSTTQQAPVEKKRYGLLAGEVVEITERNQADIKLLSDNTLFLDPSWKISDKEFPWARHITINEYQEYQQTLDKVNKEINEYAENKEYVLNSFKSFVDAKWELASAMTIPELIRATVYYKSFGKQSVVVSKPTEQSWQNTATPSPDMRQIPDAKQTQIDALKALLGESAAIWNKAFDTKVLPSLWLWFERWSDTDGTKRFSLKLKPKRWTLNPYRSYQNSVLNDLVEQLNQNSNKQDETIINDVLIFTRLRSGWRASKSLKGLLWKNQMKNLSNQKLQEKFNKKLELFKESRLSHLLTGSDPQERELATKIMESLQIAFKKFIARRILSDIRTVA